MIDTKELRPAVEAAGLNAISRDEVLELLDRLEAAEKERDNANAAAAGVALHAGAMQARLEMVEKERDALRAKIEQMERQEPVGWLLDGDFYEVRQMSLYKDNEPLPGQTALYALPGAQSVPSVSVAAMRPVINWLRNGCDPQEAAKELEILIEAAPEAKP